MLMNSYLYHGSDIVKLLTLSGPYPADHRETRTKSTFAPPVSPDIDDIEIDDLEMELLNKVPHLDRPNFAISTIVEIIPRLLFNKNYLKIDNSMRSTDVVSHTATYLTASGNYAYITGLLIYEDLSLVYDAHQEMKDVKQHKSEKEQKELNKGATATLDPRAGTESTKDNTFTSTYMMQNKNKRDTLSSVAEEEGVSEREMTITSALEGIKEDYSDENDNDNEEQNQDFIENENDDEDDHNSEEEQPPNSALMQMDKSDSTPYFKPDKRKDSLENIKIYRHSLKKSESTKNENINKKRIKMPKLLVLVSKYPIYKDMEKFLRKIKALCSEYTNIPLESMVINLVYEFPHPGEKYIVKSDLWRSKSKSIFEYETMNSMPY